MDKFQRKELSRPDEAAVVLVDEVECEDCEQIGEHKMDGKVRVGVVNEVEPVEGQTIISG